MNNEGHVLRRGIIHRRLGDAASRLRNLNKLFVFTPTATWPSTDLAGPTETPAATPANAASTTPPVAPPAPTNPAPVPSNTATSAAPAATSSNPATTPAAASSSAATTSAASAPASSSASSSSASSSSVSSSSSSSSSVAPSPTTPAVAPTTHAPAAISTPPPASTVMFTTHLGNSLPASAVASSALPSSSTAPTSGVSTPVLVGGLAAGAVGVAGVIFAIVYFMRRSSHEDEDPSDFDADAFRGQSMVLPDNDGPSPEPMSRSNTTGGPNMMERRLASPAPTYGGAPSMHHPYGMPPPPPGGYYNDYAAGQPSFMPGQIMSFGPGQVVPPSPAPAHFPPVAPIYAPNPFHSFGETPLGSPVSVAPYDSAYDAQGRLINRQPSNGAQAYLSRQPSSAGMMGDMGQGNDSHYVDLDRSSVTPFQAAQYAEISRHLNTEPPFPLPTATMVQDMHGEEDLPPVPEKETIVYSPVRPDSQMSPTAMSPQHAFGTSPFAENAKRGTFGVEDPVMEHYGVDTLDDLQQRPFSPISLDIPAALRPAHSPLASSFNASSPLASSYMLPSPPANAHFPDSPKTIQPMRAEPEQEPALPASPILRQHAGPVSPIIHEHVTPASPTEHEPMSPISATIHESMGPMSPTLREPVNHAETRPDTVYTMYDDDDAYGGI
ncbi:hypothetical protein CERSUDRAFT_112980 [Gelatoporia subvermispora B]|uniref:Uncharacterized protein n=1 Tax=Ceriporiopsis subvermispora (strain B) TaxID=914234 RepID=M2PRU2_CERS8|nr:hypothetical protein CERSUDRAFT_112980 [Gelatoporia subvermispora B]